MDTVAKKAVYFKVGISIPLAGIPSSVSSILKEGYKIVEYKTKENGMEIYLMSEMPILHVESESLTLLDNFPSIFSIDLVEKKGTEYV